MRGTARIVAVATVGMAGLLLAACTPPEGVDGDLVNGWQAMPEPVGFVPEAGLCHEQEEHLETASLADYSPIECDGVHQAETVHVGEFTGDVAERVTPPTPGSAAWQSAYQQCDEAAAAYLGADFRYAELWLGVIVPLPEAWEGGARWLRCDVREQSDGDLWGTLAGTLGGSSELLLGCFVATVSEDIDTVEDMGPVACTEPHDAEFVGVHKVSGRSYPEEDAAWRQIHDGCLTLVAEYVGVPDDGDLPFRSGTIAVPMVQADWDNGDRGIRCYLWLDGTEVSESLRDAGPEGLPIR